MVDPELVAIGAEAPARLTDGHGPNEFLPYAVSVGLRPAGPLTVTWDAHEVAGDNPFAFEHPLPPKGTGKTLLLLGADSQLGRDEFMRILYGGRVSLEVAAGAAIVALLIGAVLGSLAGYFRGLVDAVVSRFTDLVMAFPLVLFLVMIGSLFSYGLTRWTFGGLLNQGVFQLILIIGLFTWFYPAMDAGTAIGVAMYVETVFGLPGLGRTLLRALAGLEGHDLPVILAVTLVAAAAIILLNMLADLVLLTLDPTVARRGGRGVFRMAGRAT